MSHQCGVTWVDWSDGKHDGDLKKNEIRSDDRTTYSAMRFGAGAVLRGGAWVAAPFISPRAPQMKFTTPIFNRSICYCVTRIAGGSLSVKILANSQIYIPIQLYTETPPLSQSLFKLCDSLRFVN